MRFAVVFFAGVSLLTAQQRVPAGAQREIVLPIPAPRQYGMIDILASDAKVRIAVVLPDGQEVTENNAEQAGLTWTTAPEAEVKARVTSSKDLLPSGPGNHTFVGLGEKPLSGTYRIRIDARQATATSTAAASYFSLGDVFMKSVGALPGVKITNTEKVQPRSTDTKLSLSLTATAGDALIDVALTDPRVEVTLRFPDGTIVTRENAEANGVTWDLMTWPPESQDDFGFGAMIALSTMLPVEGPHQVISFESGVRISGNYVIQVNASRAVNISEASAMFLPLDALSKDDLANREPPRGLTRVVANVVAGDHFPLDKIGLTISLSGARLRAPVRFITHATLTPPGLDRQPTPIKLQIPFRRAANGTYHGVFVPPLPGGYRITTEVRGRQVSGRPFAGTGEPVYVSIHPLAATLVRLTERAVDTDGNGRPDQLDISALVDVVEPGGYRLDIELGDSGSPGITKRVEATLGRGPQEITASFSGLELYELMKVDGPYRVVIRNLHRGGGSLAVSDIRKGSSLTTAPYRREDWDRGGFYGTSKISGAPVDIKGNGKFQRYRVHWDAVTPGGNCEWEGDLLQMDVHGSVRAHAVRRLTPGLSTLEMDFDGNGIAKAGGHYVWEAEISEVTCDGAKMPATRSSGLIQMDTEILRAEDFEPTPPDFRVEPRKSAIKLLPGGRRQTVQVNIEPIGQFDPNSRITLRLSGLPPTVTVEANTPLLSIYNLGQIDLRASAVAQAGEYPIQVVATAVGQKHEFTLRLIVEAPVASNRKSVMLVLGANSTVMDLGCDAAKLFARRFKEGLRPGIDALGIVEFAMSVRIALPLTADFEAASQKPIEDFSRAGCFGWSSTLYALEKAHEQLKGESARETERVVVMLFSNPPGAITAKWPVRTHPDWRMDYQGKEWLAPPSGCSDNQGRSYPDLGWGTGGSMPDRTGTLGAGQKSQLMGPLAPTEAGLATETANRRNRRCGFSAPFRQQLYLDVAYLPETDLGGVPLDGPRPLARFDDGPYKGKIRPDSIDNVQAALDNLFDRTLKGLLDDGIRVIGIYVNKDSDAAKLDSFFKHPEGMAINAGKPPRTLLAIHDREPIVPMLERVWESLGMTRRP